MSETVYVRPAEGARVRLPGLDFALLPLEGRAVTRDAFILRRLADGDLVEGEPPKPGEPVPPPAGPAASARPAANPTAGAKSASSASPAREV